MLITPMVFSIEIVSDENTNINIRNLDYIEMTEQINALKTVASVLDSVKINFCSKNHEFLGSVYIDDITEKNCEEKFNRKIADVEKLLLVIQKDKELYTEETKKMFDNYK